MKKILSILFVVLLMALLVTGCAPSDTAPTHTPSNTVQTPQATQKRPAEEPAVQESREITILHTNDMHGYDSAIDLFTGEQMDAVIGQDTVAAIYNSFQREDGPVFLLDAGDAVQGIYFVTENEGEAAIEIMNEVGYDAMTLGNHEFDYGWFRLMQLIGNANFPILSQLDDEEAQQMENLLHYTVIERAGVKLGVFGITTPETQFKSDGGFGRDFGTVDSIIAYAQDMVRVLREEERVDYVVCLAHLGITDAGYGTSYDIRDNVDGIDLIIDGHSHTVLEDIENVEGKTQITSTGAYGANLGVARLARKQDNTVVQVELMDVAACRQYEPNPEVSDLIETWNKKVEKVGNTVMAQIPFDITVARKYERTQETVMGDMLTDAMRAVSGADIAMQNGGSIRDQQLHAGDITTAQIVTILPYGNVLQMAEVSGAVVLECMEQSASVYPEENGGFMQVSGMEYSFDPQQPVGQRITNVTIAGEPLDVEKIYTLCTNDFIAAGGDEYSMLVEPFSSQLQLKMPEYMAIENALVWYLAEHQKNLNDQVQGRITVADS